MIPGLRPTFPDSGGMAVPPFESQVCRPTVTLGRPGTGSSSCLALPYGGRRGRGRSTSRQESDGSSKENKESSKSDVKMTADKIRKLVAKFLKELSSKTNPSLLVFLGSWFVLLSEETTHAWMFMRELKYVTDPELINQYKEAEVRREEWFEANGWFTPKVERDKLTLLSYDSVVDINGRTEQDRGTQDAFVKFLGTPEGPCRTADYDRTICGALPARGAFGSRTTFSIIEKYESVQISVNGSTTILDDGINSTAPATPRTAGAKSAGQSGKKVSFSKLQLNTAVQEAVKNTVQETVAALEKKGWHKP